MTKLAGKLIVGGHDTLMQPARYALAEVGEGARAVDLQLLAVPRVNDGGRIRVDLPVAHGKRGQAQQCGEIVAEDLGAQILHMREPGEPRDCFQTQTMLKSLKCLPYAPALVVEGGEGGGWPGGVVDQAGGEHAHLALGSDDADQAHRDLGLARVRSQRHLRDWVAAA